MIAEAGHMARKKLTKEEQFNIVQQRRAEDLEKINHYKEIAKNAAKGNRYGQEDVGRIRDQLITYIEETIEKRQPLTMAGLEIASGLSRETYNRYLHGDIDYKLYEYMELHQISPEMEDQEIITDDGEVILLSRMSSILQNARRVVQEQLERNCYTNKGNPAGSIFGLKAAFGWQDQPADARTITNNTLVINKVATPEEAEEALKRLER